jgi:hypothetical protein
MGGGRAASPISYKAQPGPALRHRSGAKRRPRRMPWEKRRGQREDPGKGPRGGPKDPFPPLGAPYPKRGLVRIGRKGRKSIISRPERRTTRAGTPEDPGPGRLSTALVAQPLLLAELPVLLVEPRRGFLERRDRHEALLLDPVLGSVSNAASLRHPTPSALRRFGADVLISFDLVRNPRNQPEVPCGGSGSRRT